jgi:GNAT superfamily N-acetyltransferase
MDADQFEIKYLSEDLRYVQTAAAWIYDEFIKDVRDDLTIGDITANIGKCNKDALPVRLAAVIGGKCVGTVSIVENDLKCRDYTPWLAALYVDKAHRNKGIAKALISSAQEAAWRLGYKEMYLRTEHASGYYRKLGWQFVERCADGHGLEPDVFKITLSTL